MRSVALSLALLLAPLSAQACIDSVVETTPSFPADVQELVTRVTFCSALVRSLNEKGDENGADEFYGKTCISDETLEADILRTREAHKDSPEIQLLLNNLPPYKD